MLTKVVTGAFRLGQEAMENVVFRLYQVQPENHVLHRNEHYNEAERIVRSLKVVNDAAERCVKLIQDYNNILTKDEEQKQFLLQVIQQHRHIYPDSRKSTVVAGLTDSTVSADSITL